MLTLKDTNCFFLIQKIWIFHHHLKFIEIDDLKCIWLVYTSQSVQIVNSVACICFHPQQLCNMSLFLLFENKHVVTDNCIIWLHSGIRIHNDPVQKADDNIPHKYNHVISFINTYTIQSCCDQQLHIYVGGIPGIAFHLIHYKKQINIPTHIFIWYLLTCYSRNWNSYSSYRITEICLYWSSLHGIRN